ncbi:MAG: hypothetical protein DRN29_06295 [Thermoplasmata archaeon]|nr:MAG: hypothetical protein DRN29_06295 [Thermoplasmata archaeon]
MGECPREFKSRSPRYLIFGKRIIRHQVDHPGKPYFPSIAAFTKRGELLVGEAAKRQAIMNPEGTVHHIKRKMGKNEKIGIRNILQNKFPLLSFKK